MRKEQGSWGVENEFKSIFWKVMQKNNWNPEDFATKETKEERSVSSSIDGIHSENVKPGEKHLLDNFEVLAMHPSQYGETEVLEMKIDLVPGAIPYKS